MPPNPRSIALSTSTDFAKWSTPELVFHADDEDRARAPAMMSARAAEPERWLQPTHTQSDGPLSRGPCLHSGRPSL